LFAKKFAKGFVFKVFLQRFVKIYF
jgi:hypothetical protein